MGRPFLIVKEMVMPPEVYGAVRLDLDPYPIMINKLHCKGRKLVSLVHESLHIAEKELDFQMIGTQGHQDLHVLATLLTSSILPLMKRLRTMPNPTGRFRFQLNQFPFRLQHTGCASLECEQETLLEILRRSSFCSNFRFR